MESIQSAPVSVCSIPTPNNQSVTCVYHYTPQIVFSDLFCIVLIRILRGNCNYRQGQMGRVAYSPRLRKSKTLCIVYFLLVAWSSNLRTRICSLLKTVSQSIKYTMYKPTCNLTWGHKAGESMWDNRALSRKRPPRQRDTVVHAWLNFFKVMNSGREGKPEEGNYTSSLFHLPNAFSWVMLGTVWACEHVLVSCGVSGWGIWERWSFLLLRNLLSTCQWTRYSLYTPTWCCYLVSPHYCDAFIVIFQAKMANICWV